MTIKLYLIKLVPVSVIHRFLATISQILSPHFPSRSSVLRYSPV
jgi:hypothetical protein